MTPFDRNPQQPAVLLTALAEPNRLLIVEQLREGPLTVGELADRLQLRQPQVSKHLRVLLDGEIVEVQAEGNRRIYRLRAEPFQRLHDWLDTYRSMWEKKLDSLEQYLRNVQKQAPINPKTEE